MDNLQRQMCEILKTFSLDITFFLGLPMMRLGNEFQIYGSFDNVEENKIWYNINMIASMKKSQHSSIAKQHFSCSKVKQLQYAKCHTRNLSDTHQQTIFFLSFLVISLFTFSFQYRIDQGLPLG